MKLRNSIRPPARYSSGFIYTSPSSNMSLRKRRILCPIVELDPNLPPAAFPTLDIQRERRASYANVIHRGPSTDFRQTPDSGRRDGQNGDEEKGVDFQDTPLDELENYAASNGEHNPVYVRNMAILGALTGDSTSSLEKEMEDSDLEVATNSNEQQGCPETTLPISDESWKGLCPHMQVEIFVNLLQYHRWWDASEMLGFAVEDHENLRMLLAERDEQTDLEDAGLSEMRERQLRALLMLDNSNRRHGQSSCQLVFRKISRQTRRILKESLETDYITCPAKDVADAKVFLQKRGIDDRFVGEWADCINPLGPSRDYTGPEALPSGELEPEPAVSTNSPNLSSSNMFGSLKTTQHSPVNTVETSSATGTTDPSQSRGDLNLPSEWLTFLHQNYSHAVESFRLTPQNDGLIRLRVNAERAAQVEKPERAHCEPAKLWHEFPPLDLFFYDSPPPGLDASDRNPTPEPKTDGNPQSQLESMCETHLDSAPAVPLVTSSMRLQQRSEEARVEAWREKPDDYYDTDISELITTLTPISRSASRSPGLIQPDDDQISVNFSDWVRSSAYDSDSDDPESDVTTEMSDEGNTATSSVTPSTLDGLSVLLLSAEDKSPVMEEEESSEEEDEMVMLPVGPILRQCAA
ncbi:hypothetical protein P168DRAFT_278404 [Aspergillus campestris IBT 28561]|uniref:Uncharacterized protein n=1 Tax=Aspergillus campestris (strain IBT 28561) TaxID=1392248 RepID=A0A2I1DG59_ASPC2|nr:uncharacterized protein P168DRAFT_278404 [Aspergillus campestris IBT 28561]PKY08856.1 hypothetical protein P168DRAFT_278404 [Aspergillus campestris IBT 28561]